MSELEQALQAFLLKALQVAEQTGKFLIDQAPDLLQQFYRWEYVRHGLGILLSFIILVAGWSIPRLWGSKTPFENKHYDYKEFKAFGLYYNVYNEHEVPAIIIWVGAIIVSACLFCVHMYSFLYLIISPKMYLINHFIH